MCRNPSLVTPKVARYRPQGEKESRLIPNRCSPSIKRGMRKESGARE